jgi:hypothetical protein
MGIYTMSEWYRIGRYDTKHAFLHQPRGSDKNMYEFMKNVD